MTCYIDLIQGDSGSGKSGVLQTLLFLSESTTAYFDVKIVDKAANDNIGNSNYETEAQVLHWFQFNFKKGKTTFLIDNIDDTDSNFSSSGDRYCSDISYVLLMIRDEIIKSNNKSNLNQYQIIATCTNLHHVDPSLLLPSNSIVSTIQKPDSRLRLNMLNLFMSTLSTQHPHISNINCQSSSISLTNKAETAITKTGTVDLLKLLVSQTQGYSLTEFISFLKNAYTEFQLTMLQPSSLQDDNISLETLLLSSLEYSKQFTDDSNQYDEFKTSKQANQDINLVGIDEVLNKIKHLLYSSDFNLLLASCAMSLEAQTQYLRYVSELDLPSPSGEQSLILILSFFKLYLIFMYMFILLLFVVICLLTATERSHHQWSLRKRQDECSTVGGSHWHTSLPEHHTLLYQSSA